MGQERRSTVLGRRDEGRWEGLRGRRQVGVWREEVNCLEKGGICDHVKIKIRKRMYETTSLI